MSRIRRAAILAAILVVPAGLAFRAVARMQDRPKLGYTDTPSYPGSKYRVHDGDRPQPAVIDPGTASNQETPGRPPSDAVVLFDGKDLSRWNETKGVKAVDGVMVISGSSPSSKDEFGDVQLHVEWTSPNPPKGRDQGRGNSGVMMFGRYEIQVLDCFENLTYADGQAAAIYGQYPPLVNACRKPGEWQTYDIVFTAPRFKDDGSLESPAYLTMLHNGVLVHDHTALRGPVVFKGLAKYEKHGPKGPIVLQDHGNPVKFRNIWARPIKGYDQP